MSARHAPEISDSNAFYNLVKNHIGGEKERPAMLAKAIAKAAPDANPVDVVRDALGDGVASRAILLWKKQQAGKQQAQLYHRVG